MSRQRCRWAGDDPLMVRYHDEEWGLPVYDNRKLFEFVVLDTFQAGLSWRTILHKREALDRAFVHFEAEAVAAFGPGDVERLMQDAGIIRNRQKIESTISNAREVLRLQEEGVSLSDYLWQFVGGRPLVHAYQSDDDIKATEPEGDAMSLAMRKRGFRFVGPTVCYAFMQGAGLVNDHPTSCFRFEEIVKQGS